MVRRSLRTPIALLLLADLAFGAVPMAAQTTTAVGRSTLVIGSAWDADNLPIPSARIRLRDILSGRITSTVVANESGEFRFESVEGGNYLIELVDEDGNVLAIGEAFSIQAGETVITFVRLPPRRRGLLGGLWGLTAAAAIAAAAGLGIAAVEPCDCPEVSPER